MNNWPAEFWQGVEQFNQGEFYACHDTLESLWIEAHEPERTFLQGVLQLAVACYHLQNQNQRGAILLLAEGGRRLTQYDSIYGGVDVDSLRLQAKALLESLQAGELPQTRPKLEISTAHPKPNLPNVDGNDDFDGE